jgi:hypothetical protein
MRLHSPPVSNIVCFGVGRDGTARNCMHKHSKIDAACDISRHGKGFIGMLDLTLMLTRPVDTDQRALFMWACTLLTMHALI